MGSDVTKAPKKAAKELGRSTDKIGEQATRSLGDVGLGSDFAELPGKALDIASKGVQTSIVGATRPGVKAVEETLRVGTDIGEFFEGPDFPDPPPVEPLVPPIQGVSPESSAARRDEAERRRRASGRSQSNKRLRPLTQTNNQPSLGIALG